MLRKSFRLWVIVLAAGIALLQPALARVNNVTTCPRAADIVAVADFLLVEPTTDPKPDRRETTTHSAFLKIRYGGLSYAASRRLVDRIRQWRFPPAEIDDLRLAFARPVDRAVLLRGVHPIDVAPPIGPSVLRAMILDDKGRQIFPEMKRRAAQPGGLRGTAFDQYLVASTLFVLSETQKTEIAGWAEAAGLWELAEHLLASKTTPDEWLALVRRAPGAPTSQEALTERFRRIWTDSAPFYFDRPRRTLWRELPPELRVAADAADLATPEAKVAADILDFGRRLPQSAMLLYRFALAGDHRTGIEFSRSILAELKARQWDMVHDHDEIQILVFNRLGHVLSRAEAVSLLSRSPSTAARPEAGGERMLDVMESAAARRALLPYLHGNGDIPPARPDLLTQEFDWASWVTTAEMIRSRRPTAQVNRRAEVELLDALERHRDALASLRQMPAEEYRRDRAYRMLASLDERCASLRSRSPELRATYRFEPR